jgi:hypothetical protein
MSETEIRETFDYLLDKAKEALGEGHSFAPFAAGVRADGRRTHMGLDLAGQPPTAQDHIATLVSALRQDHAANVLKVASLAFDGEVHLREGEVAAAICMHIEVKGGECLEAFVPYVRAPDKSVEYFGPIFAPSDHEVFR